MRGAGFRLAGNLGLADRAMLEAVARAFRARLAIDDRSIAYRRRKKCRGRGTAKGIGLATSVLRRWMLLQPLPRPEGRA